MSSDFPISPYKPVESKATLIIIWALEISVLGFSCGNFSKVSHFVCPCYFLLMQQSIVIVNICVSFFIFSRQSLSARVQGADTVGFQRCATLFRFGFKQSPVYCLFCIPVTLRSKLKEWKSPPAFKKCRAELPLAATGCFMRSPGTKMLAGWFFKCSPKWLHQK